MQKSKMVEMLKDAGVQWNVDGELIDPTEDDLQEVLDKAATMLYGESTGTKLQVAGLIMEKRPLGHDVYVYAGNHE